jgi:hypothetical protein
LIETITDERMYKAGLLRIAVKMRTTKRSFETCVKDVVTELRLDPEGFRKYVSLHFSEVVATVKTQGSRIYWEI